MSQKRARVRRSESPAPRPERARQVVRATGPGDLLRFVPDLLTAEPRDSLVVILFRRARGTRSRTHGAMRVDLRHTEDQEELEAWASAVLGRVLRVDGVTGVAIAAYTPESFAPSGRPPAAVQVRAVARQAERMGLEVLDRFCVGADGWGSLADPELPRGGRPLSLIEPDPPRRQRSPLPAPASAPDEQRLRFADHYDAWWRRPDGPGGVLHGVDLGTPRPGARAIDPGAPAAAPAPGERPSPMDRYRFGEDPAEVVELVEGCLAPHDGDRPCPCRALLASLAERQGLIPMLLGQLAWGPAFGRELWTAFAAPDGRERTAERLRSAIGGGRFARPDVGRLEAAVAALEEAAGYLDVPRIGSGIDEALAWLHWARGGASTAAALAERSLAQHADRDLAPILIAKTQRGDLPLWAFRKDPRRPDRFDALLGDRERAVG